MIFCYTDKSIPYPVIIREVSSGSKWEQMQRSTARQYVERESKLEISVQFLPSELREAHRRGGGKIVGSTGDGGHQESRAL